MTFASPQSGAQSAIQRIQGRIEEIQQGLGRRAPAGPGFENAVARAGGKVESAVSAPADGAAPPSLGPNGTLPGPTPGLSNGLGGLAGFGRAGRRQSPSPALDVTTSPPGVDPADLGATPVSRGGTAAYKDLIAGAADRHGVDPALVRAVMAAESGGNPQARSPVGAMGLMQLMPGTAKDLGVANAYDPAQNVEGGVKYLARLTEKYGVEHGVAAYNAGPGAVEKYGGVPPYRETRGYVDRVMKLYGQFNHEEAQMIRGLYTSSAGMQVEQVRQEMIANNLANVNTSGFRRDLAILEARGKMNLNRTADPVRVGPDLKTKRTGIGDIGTGVLVNRVVKRFEQGTLKKTDEPFDLALEGDGYFTLADKGGGKLYTRSGEFTIDMKGQVVDHDGRTVLGMSGGPIRVPAGGVFQVSPDGTVAINGTPIDRLAIARIDRPDEDLERMGDTSFAYRGTGQPAQASAMVHQGQLEGANVNSVHEMVEMIAALRHYEANQKALQAHDETLGKAVNEIARN